jgi:iron complex outermembrane receptor protein
VESGVPYFENFLSSPRVIFPLMIDNLTRGRTSGIEAFANWELTRRMRFHGSYSFLQMKLRSKNQNPFLDAAGAEGQSPRHQAQVHALLDLPRKFEFDTALYYASRLPSLQIPSNTRLDARLGWRIKERLDLSVGLQNLLDNRHPEFGGLDTNVVLSQVKRSFYGKATWKF